MDAYLRPPLDFTLSARPQLLGGLKAGSEQDLYGYCFPRQEPRPAAAGSESPVADVVCMWKNCNLKHVIEGEMYTMRRLCGRSIDFKAYLNRLRSRCITRLESCNEKTPRSLGIRSMPSDPFAFYPSPNPTNTKAATFMTTITNHMRIAKMVTAQ
jgi:hypothetical protein